MTGRLLGPKTALRFFLKHKTLRMTLHYHRELDQGFLNLSITRLALYQLSCAATASAICDKIGEYVILKKSINQKRK